MLRNTDVAAPQRTMRTATSSVCTYATQFWRGLGTRCDNSLLSGVEMHADLDHTFGIGMDLPRTQVQQRWSRPHQDAKIV
jgi:hypothetical protein